MDDFWGRPGAANPTYSQALREFVRFHANTKIIRELRRHARQQAELERKWHRSRSELVRNGADEAKLADFDRRIHFQATKFAENLEIRLGEDLKLPLFREPAPSPALRRDRAKFMLFLSDLIAGTI